MPQTKTRIPQLPVATILNDEDYIIVEQGNITKRGLIETLSDQVNHTIPSVTYAQLVALSGSSSLVTGKEYLILDATVAEINLIVQAMSSTQIYTLAKSPDFPQDVIHYDFAANVIKWRWDTLNDISVAQDLRNLVGFTLGTSGTYPFGCSKLHIGVNATGTIGNSSNNSTIGNDTFAEGVIQNCTIGNLCSLACTTINNSILEDGATISSTGTIAISHFQANCNWAFTDDVTGITILKNTNIQIALPATVNPIIYTNTDIENYYYLFTIGISANKDTAGTVFFLTYVDETRTTIMIDAFV